MFTNKYIFVKGTWESIGEVIPAFDVYFDFRSAPINVAKRFRSLPHYESL